MKSHKVLSSLTKTIFLALALCVGMSAVSIAAVPANGTAAADRGQAADGNGKIFSDPAFLGFHVFTATASVPILLSDELGNPVIQGMIDKVCISSSSLITDYVVLYDTTTLATTAFTQAMVNTAVGNFSNTNIASDMSYQITPQIEGILATERCVTLDAQFYNGVVILQNRAVTTALPTAHVYWRSGRGGRQ